MYLRDTTTRRIATCAVALALLLPLAAAPPAAATPAADDRPTATVLTWLSHGLGWLADVAGRLGAGGAQDAGSGQDGAGGDGTGDPGPVVLDDDGGDALRPERIGYGLSVARR